MSGRHQPISRNKPTISTSRSRSRNKPTISTSRSRSRSRSRERESNQIDTPNLGYDVKCSTIKRVKFENMNEINRKYPIPEKITPENIKEAYRNIMFQYIIVAYTRPNIHDDYYIPLKTSYDKYSELLGITKKYSNIPDELVLGRDCPICYHNLTNLNIVKCSDVKSLDKKYKKADACTTDACVGCHERLITPHREKRTANNELPPYRCLYCDTPLDISRIEEKINFYKSLPKKEELEEFNDVFENVVEALINLKRIIDSDDETYNDGETYNDDETYNDELYYKQVTGNIIWEPNKPNNKKFVAEFGDYSVFNTNNINNPILYKFNRERILKWHREIRNVYLENMFIGWDENRETLYGFVKNKNSIYHFNYSYSEDAHDFLNYMKTCEIIGFKTKGKTHKEIMDNWAKISSVNNVNKIYFTYNNKNDNFMPDQDYSPTSSTSPFYYIDPINYDLLYGKGAFYKKIYPNIKKLESVGFKYPNDDIINNKVNTYIQSMIHEEKSHNPNFLENVCEFVYKFANWSNGGRKSRKGGRKSRKGERKSRKGGRKSKKSKK